MARYWMSWEDGQDRRRRPQLSRRDWIKLGLLLLALLLLVLLALLVILGHEARHNETNRSSSGNNVSGTGPMERVAVATHTGYAFAAPDFMPGAEAPGLPDLSRLTWDFMWGCSTVLRLLVLVVLPAAISVAYWLGYRAGQR